MGLRDLFRRRARYLTMGLVGHIVDDPQIVSSEGSRYMIFHLAEVAGTDIRLKMLPTTPMRHRADRVEITWTMNGTGPARVDSLYSAPDAAEICRRNQEYLSIIESQDGKGTR
jgi:hypothetical protein